MRKQWKVLSIFMILTIVMTMVVGCKSNEKEADSKAGDITDNKSTSKVELRIVTMFGGTDPSTEVFEQSLKDYMKDHPNVIIKNESMTAVGDEFRTKVKTDFATGNEPDVTFFFTGADAAGIIKAGKVMPYEEVWTKYPNVGKDITDGVKESMRAEDNKIYALPMTGFYEGLFVNKALFEKHNLELPTTWDNLVKAVEVFSANDIVPFAGPIAQSHYMIEHFVLSQAGAEGHKDVLDGDVPTDWVQGFNNIKDLYEMKAFAADALTMDIELAQNLFKQEKSAMILEGSWFIGGCEDTLKEKMTVMPIPVAPNGKMDATSIVAGYSTGYYISRKAYEDEAKQATLVDLVEFLTSADQIKAIAKANGGTPSANVQVEGLPALATEGHQMAAKAKTLNMPIDSRLTPEAFNYIVKDGVPYIVEGQRTPEEVLKEVKNLNQ